MAEAIAKLVLDKLADAAVKEALSLYGAGDKLDSLRHELIYIQAFLKDAESKRNANEMVKNWVKDVQEAAYKIEDVIDIFMAEVYGRKVNCFKRNLKFLIKLPTVHNLTSEMDKIQTRLREMKECTEKYGINKELGDSSSAVPMRRPVVLPDEDDPDIVGLQNDTMNIVKLLVDPNTKRCRVVSIVGQGGLGKTTLARKAYNSDEVKKEFPYRIWLSISQQYKLLHLLKTMLEKIRPLKENEKALLQSDDQYSWHTAEVTFIKNLKESLSEKRYLIIMDDVWSNELWIHIKAALPDVGNGSRVLVTTRFSDIAKHADPTSDPYKLHFLSEEESQHLLLKKAFPFQDRKTYPHELSDLSKTIAERCGGLPLALEVIGGLLSRQPPLHNSWNMVFEKFSWHGNEGKKCTEILATSYEDLPFFLKPCFMHFALFPESYKIEAKSLIRMWVAEGFIPDKAGRTMEQTAEDYLEELVQRSMIQVSHRYFNGSIKYCRIHHLLHDLAIEKCKENMFLEIIPSQGGSYTSSTVTLNVRRAALHYDHNDIMGSTGPNLRSLFFFGPDLPNVEKFRLLKILNGNRYFVRNRDIINGDLFMKLSQLRYIEAKGNLGVRSYHGSTFSAERQFWKSISRMRNLQTLDIPRMETGSNLPNCIWDVKTLRHVILPANSYGPSSKADLPNLQTLKVVKVRAEWVAGGWPKMPSIQVLKIRDFYEVAPNYGESFRSFLGELRHLTSLTVDNFRNPLFYDMWNRSGDPLYYDMKDMSVFPWYNRLQSLCVIGKWMTPKKEFVPVVVTTKSFPIHLTKLRLRGSEITNDPMPILEKLESLKLLELIWDAYVGTKLCCSAGGFPRLQFLMLRELRQLEEWKVDVEGETMPIMPIMPMLKEINLYDCNKLRLIPGLRHITSLTKFTLRGGSPDLYQSLREDKSHRSTTVNSFDI